MTFRINFNTNPPTADRTPLPQGMTSDWNVLRNLTQHDGLPAEAEGCAWYADERYEPRQFDAATHTADESDEGIEVLEINTLDKFVRYTRKVRPLSEEEKTERAEALKLVKARLVQSIDDLIASIYSRWMRFEAEYVQREAAARAYIQAGYVGDPGVWVASFASSAGKTNQQAADLIIAQADGLRAALQQLGALRMTKYAVVAASDAAAAQATHDEIIAQANAIASTIQ